jgi:hypothetical protein
MLTELIGNQPEQVERVRVVWVASEDGLVDACSVPEPAGLMVLDGELHGVLHSCISSPRRPVVSVRFSMGRLRAILPTKKPWPRLAVLDGAGCGNSESPQGFGHATERVRRLRQLRSPGPSMPARLSLGHRCTARRSTPHHPTRLTTPCKESIGQQREATQRSCRSISSQARGFLILQELHAALSVHVVW